MKQLRYIGNNKPQGMVIEVEEKNVEKLLDSGDYEDVGGAVSKKVKEVKKDGNNIIKSSKRF